MQKISFTFFLLLNFYITSCAQTPQKQRVKKVLNPQTTQRSQVSKKETGVDPKVIELYRRLRKKNWKNYTNPQRYQPALPPREAYRKKVTKNPLPKELPERTQKEINAEAQQNLSYFCIQHEGKSPHSAYRSCKAYTKKVYNDCLEQHDGVITRKLVSCIKERLR